MYVIYIIFCSMEIDQSVFSIAQASQVNEIKPNLPFISFSISKSILKVWVNEENRNRKWLIFLVRQRGFRIVQLCVLAFYFIWICGTFGYSRYLFVLVWNVK